MKPLNRLLSYPRFLMIRTTAAALLLLFTAASLAAAQTSEQIAKKALAATVYLELQDSTGETVSFGSGFFVQQHVIATNYHFIEGVARGTAKLVGKSTKYTIEGVIGIDETNDLALLKVTASGVKPLPLGESDAVQIGEQVYVAGNPKGLEGTFSDGFISSHLDSETSKRLQVTAPISSSSGGGPVLNRKGKVIGVSHITMRGVQTLNFAIPSKYLKALLAEQQPSKDLSQVSSSISAETYFYRGNTRYNLGDYKGAISHYDSSIRIKPDVVEVYSNRGNAKAYLGQYAAAIADYDTAIRIAPDYAFAYNNRGFEKIQLGQYAAAITDCDNAIVIKPDYTEAYYNRGNAKVKLGQYAAAIADYDSAIRIEPDHATAYNHRGVAKTKLGQYAAAIPDYDSAIVIKPDYTEAYYNRAYAKIQLGQYAAAIADYDSLIGIKPDYAEAYYRRGLTKAMLNRRSAAAKRDLETALSLAEAAGDLNLKSDIEEALQILE